GEAGDFVIDARLGAGDHRDHPLTFSRPGIDAVTLTVGVTVAADGKATAAIRDAQGTQLVTATTTAATAEQSVLARDIPNPVAARPACARRPHGLEWPLRGAVCRLHAGQSLPDLGRTVRPRRRKRHDDRVA